MYISCLCTFTTSCSDTKHYKHSRSHTHQFSVPELHSLAFTLFYKLALTNFSLVYTDQGSCFYKSMACNLLACRTEQGWPQKTWKMTHISHLGAGCSTTTCWAPVNRLEFLLVSAKNQPCSDLLRPRAWHADRPLPRNRNITMLVLKLALFQVKT